MPPPTAPPSIFFSSEELEGEGIVFSFSGEEAGDTSFGAFSLLVG